MRLTRYVLLTLRCNLSHFQIKSKWTVSGTRAEDHSVRSKTKVCRTELLLFIFLSNQNWGSIIFEVNFGPLIQPNSISSLHSFYRGQSGLHCGIRIRTSEDVRTSKKVEVCFYLLAQRSTRYLMQPLLLFAWHGQNYVRLAIHIFVGL